MSKYMLIYQGSGPSGPPPGATEEQMKEVMDAWGVWMGKVGPALVDIGSPTGERSSVGGSGSPVGVNGYSLVEAEDMEAAKGLCDGHPFLASAPSDYSIDIFELVPIEM